ncbi:hypothetical protein HPB52_013225 [Rhipicephalus sanguineus]|uniref:Uncharacterized protein n=1 Tax=Rhipicephalus sanguineus TaxID=34632 RepID=A0A9D4T3Y7_RHISA|nr:hypothetical protein HPB52_013225 [Rhipicephalus sanguineus]
MESVLLSDTQPDVSRQPRLSRVLPRDMPDAMQLPDRWRRPESPESNEAPAQEAWPIEDTSQYSHGLIYIAFVLSLVVAMSASLLTVPVLLKSRVVDCPRGCFTLDRKLKDSLNHSVHPCDDFYAGITHFKRGTAGGENIDKLRDFLQDLGLPWPSKSTATRPQLLNILVRASLEFGMPMFWAFYVGRHPNRPSENTIYMTLDPRCSDWFRHIRALADRGRENDYLRRGAEVVGRKGQSYSRMIRYVLDTHFEIVELAQLYWGDDTVPRFNNLSDPDLRRAINGHLPDDSQLWPEDRIINLQPEFFAKLDEKHLKRIASQEQFKLFLGAYVVWALSPLISNYMTSSLMADMGLGNSEGDYHFFRCAEALQMLMPLVLWRLSNDAQKDRTPTWNVLRLSMRSFSAWTSAYGGAIERLTKTVSSRFAANAFNMSFTWEMLDNAYSYFPNYTDTTFFDLYKSAAHASASFFKRSLRRPEHSIYHLPGIATIELYRLLVGREVVVHQYLTSSPLYETWHPAAVISAVAGTRTSRKVFILMWFLIFYNAWYEVRRSADFDVAVKKLLNDSKRFFEHVAATGSFPGANERESRDVYLASIAAHTASYIQDAHEWHHASGETATSPPDEDRGGRFKGLPAEQIFFLLSCFEHCGFSGRERLAKVAICNAALPAAPRFRKAFSCSPQHRLVGNFTWPEPPEKPIDVLRPPET